MNNGQFNADHRLSFVEKLGYGMGDAASNFFFQVFNLFLLYYYTDVYGLNPAAVGTMFLATKILDAVSDPAMGIIADRTHTRWGKFRPYVAGMAVPYGLLGYAMFAGPDLSDTGKLIYAYATYSLMMLAYTAINIPYSALMGVISPSSQERVKVASYRFVCAFGASWILGTFVTPLKNILGAGNEAEGFRLTMMLFAVISIALFWFTFATTRERVKSPPSSASPKDDLMALLSNGPWLALCFSGIFGLMQVAVRSGGTLYYFKYFVGDDGTPLFLIFDKTAIFLSLSMICLVAGAAMTGWLTHRFEKRSLLIALTTTSGLLYGAFFFISSDSYTLMLLVNCLANLAAGPAAPLIFAMYADTADYGEWKLKRRTTALVYSASGFAAKMGLAFGAGLSGYILAYFGFVANVEQSENSLLGIRMMFSLVPATLAILSALVMLFYGLRRDEMDRIEQELIQRRQAAS